MPAREELNLVARAAMRDTPFVWAVPNSSVFGLLKQVVAMRFGPTAVTDGPAQEITAAEAAAIEEVAEILPRLTMSGPIIDPVARRLSG